MWWPCVTLMVLYAGREHTLGLGMIDTPPQVVIILQRTLALDGTDFRRKEPMYGAVLAGRLVALAKAGLLCRRAA